MIFLSIDRSTGEFIQPIEDLNKEQLDAIVMALLRAEKAIRKST